MDWPSGLITTVWGASSPLLTPPAVAGAISVQADVPVAPVALLPLRQSGPDRSPVAPRATPTTMSETTMSLNAPRPLHATAASDCMLVTIVTRHDEERFAYGEPDVRQRFRSVPS